MGMKSESASDILAGAYGNLFRSVPRDSMGTRWWGEVSSTLAQFRCGRGRLLVSTFNLVLPVLDDPVAAVILNDLISYAGTDFKPSTQFFLEQ
jgi:hypothetical protein